MEQKKDDLPGEMLMRQNSSLAKFPEENPNPVLRTAGDGAVLYANAATRALDGVLTDDGRQLAPVLRAAVADVFKKQTGRQIELKSGERIFEFALTPIRDEAYVNLYGRDVSEERRARRETVSLAKFPEENPNPVLRVDGCGVALFANTAARKLPGLLVEEGRKLAPALAASAEAAFATKRPVNAEFSAGPGLFAFSFVPVPDEGYINVYAREITKERQAILDVVRVRDFTKGILDNLTNGVMTFDASFVVTSANPAACRILDQDIARVVGRRLADVFAGDAAWLVEAVAAHGDSREPIVWLDRSLTTATGAQRAANLTLAPLSEDIGGGGRLLVIEDISRERRVRSTMVRFMSDRIVEQLIESDDAFLGGSTQEATIMFSDIRNFTSLSRKLGARDTVTLLNDYFSTMVDVVFENGGTLDKFIGDGMMAVFGAPFVSAEDTDRAVITAASMLAHLRNFNRRRLEQGAAPLEIGVGIDTGPVIAGTIGSPRRMDFTVIGEHVNLASRIEAVNKHYGTHILISDATRQKINGENLLREIDLVVVPGVSEPIRLFEVLNYHTEESFPNLERVLTAFDEGLQLYRGRDWRGAASAFGQALTLNEHDRPTQIFLSRCWSYMARPPGPAWQGITDLTV